MIKREVIYKCDRCDKKQVIEASETYTTCWDLMPLGWSYVRGELICDEHVVTVTEE